MKNDCRCSAADSRSGNIPFVIFFHFLQFNSIDCIQQEKLKIVLNQMGVFANKEKIVL
jgi:hypothetical protein